MKNAAGWIVLAIGMAIAVLAIRGSWMKMFPWMVGSGNGGGNNGSCTPPDIGSGNMQEFLASLKSSLGCTITIGGKSYKLDTGDYTLSGGKCITGFPQSKWPYYQNLFSGKLFLPNSKGCCPEGTSPNPLTANTLCS